MPDTTPLLGRFLEFSLHAPDVPASLAFYESLGFVQATTGDIRRHAYAVVTDGRICIGLHSGDIAAPTLSFVRPELARYAAQLEALGVELEHAQLGDDAFHELAFADPGGQRVALLEARTFSGPAAGPRAASRLGRFEGIAIPARAPAASSDFWQSLGLAPFEPAAPGWAGGLEGTGLRLVLGEPRWRHPAATFATSDGPALAAAIAARHGLRHVTPASGGPAGAALLFAPEGTALLLVPPGDRAHAAG